MLSSLSDLHIYVDKGQLTGELGGNLDYCHSQWIHHRTVSSQFGSFFCVMFPAPADHSQLGASVWPMPLEGGNT